MTGDDTQLGDVSTDDHITPVPESEEIDWEKAQRGARLLLAAVGADPESDPFVETWQRQMPAMWETLSEDTRTEVKPTLRTFETTSDDLFVKSGIPVYSPCQHHFLPYHGNAHVAYRPAGAVVGLSKLPRYVRWQSRKLTLQEQLTQDIADGLAIELEAGTVLVELSATHLCEALHGVETATETTPRAIVGSSTTAECEQFRDSIARADGLQ